MKAERENGQSAVVREMTTPAQATVDGGLRLRARSFCSACRQVFGIPDYERYLAHAAASHPSAPMLSRNEFCLQAIERRYGNGGARCC